MSPPVVDFDRMKRLSMGSEGSFKIDTNVICLFIIALVFLYCLKRFRDKRVSMNLSIL